MNYVNYYIYIHNFLPTHKIIKIFLQFPDHLSFICVSNGKRVGMNMNLDDSPNFGLTCDLFFSVIHALSALSPVGTLVLHPDHGLMCTVVDPRNLETACEVVISTINFKWFDIGDQVLYVPIHFNTFTEMIKSIGKPDDFIFVLFPTKRSYYTISTKREIVTPNTVLPPQTCVQDFDQVFQTSINLDHFPGIRSVLTGNPCMIPVEYYENHMVLMNWIHFTHQMFHALQDHYLIHIGIHEHNIFFYANNDGESEILDPTKQLIVSKDVQLLTHLGFDCTNHSTKPLTNPPPIKNPNKFIKRFRNKNLNPESPPMLIQAHSIRQLQFLAQFKQPKDSYISIGLSVDHGLVLHYAINTYGQSCYDRKNQLYLPSFIRYRLIPPRKETPREFTMVSKKILNILIRRYKAFHYSVPLPLLK